MVKDMALSKFSAPLRNLFIKPDFILTTHKIAKWEMQMIINKISKLPNPLELKAFSYAIENNWIPTALKSKTKKIIPQLTIKRT